jgi:hypothetical protein
MKILLLFRENTRFRKNEVDIPLKVNCISPSKVIWNKKRRRAPCLLLLLSFDLGIWRQPLYPACYAGRHPPLQREQKHWKGGWGIVAVFAADGGEIGGNSNEAISWVLLNTLIILPSIRDKRIFCIWMWVLAWKPWVCMAMCRYSVRTVQSQSLLFLSLLLDSMVHYVFLSKGRKACRDIF